MLFEDLIIVVDVFRKEVLSWGVWFFVDDCVNF